MKVVKLCIGEWDNASRDKRELGVCKELGFDASVIAKGDETHLDGYVDGFYVKRFQTRLFGEGTFVLANRIAASLKLAKDLRRENDISVLSCHDLIALAIGYLSNIGKAKKAILIYDSHEFEIGRNIQRSKMRKKFIVCLERFLIKKCAFSIMVNDSIADEVKRIHHLKKRPIVARSTPELWEVNCDVCSKEREKMLAILEPGVEYLLSTHGNLCPDRGIEQVIEVISQIGNLGLIILGNGEKEYVQGLMDMVRELSCDKRVLFFDAVPQNQIWKVVGATDINMVMVQPSSASYIYSLPNKFFEAIQSETPVIASDLPEMAKLVDNYQIGLHCSPQDTGAIKGCVEKMCSDKNFYADCKEAVRKAKRELCWEKEKQSLKEAYSGILIENMQ